MILSGGYQMTNAPVIADSIRNLINRFDLVNKLFKTSYWNKEKMIKQYSNLLISKIIEMNWASDAAPSTWKAQKHIRGYFLQKVDHIYVILI